MPKPELTKTLTAVRDALGDPDALEAADREQLIQLHDEIETLLELSAEARPQDRQVVHLELDSAVERFQASHPDLTRVFTSMMDALLAIGI